MDLHIHLSTTSIISIIVGILLYVIATLEILKFTTIFKSTNDSPLAAIVLSINMILLPLFNAVPFIAGVMCLPSNILIKGF